MTEFEFGRFVTSKAGHDKCKLFVIIKADSEYVYLVDGKVRTLDKPKKKKRKHVQIINAVDETLIMKKNSNIAVRDEDIKRAIKLYLA
ncbi:hypothetical protein EDD66_101295 [Mobilisporobacter senegalensis]|uniref:Ribosomal protein L14E/L6E/L27E n=1 Tax=Mobilisporobacter senegalensis TaxID=1329262 RepID=A0A3N1Y331_9FIRM|nr:KOW domain-containing RNA-binding protein [Mobilisporobacter senegalensis]ROR31677.1 hypothetical protein EDD66_101295 [Mobilisporobacter senegalensis]